VGLVYRLGFWQDGFRNTAAMTRQHMPVNLPQTGFNWRRNHHPPHVLISSGRASSISNCDSDTPQEWRSSAPHAKRPHNTPEKAVERFFGSFPAAKLALS
jgi:hypothetical protein